MFLRRVDGGETVFVGISELEHCSLHGSEAATGQVQAGGAQGPQTWAGAEVGAPGGAC